MLGIFDNAQRGISVAIKIDLIRVLYRLGTRLQLYAIS
jgi:hypothetical protein